MRNILVSLFLFSTFIACEETKKEEIEEYEPLESLLPGKWFITTASFSDQVMDSWQDFTIELNYNEENATGKYLTSNIPAETVPHIFKSEGSWLFAVNSDGSLNLGIIIIDDQTESPVAITVGQKDFRLSFEAPLLDDDSPRGTWVMNFQR